MNRTQTNSHRPSHRPCGTGVGRFPVLWLAVPLAFSTWLIVGLMPAKAANTPPVAAADAYSTDEGVALDVAAPGVLGNDSDADGDPISADRLTFPANGNVTLLPDGSFSYLPHPGFFGTDSFAYRAYDGVDYSAAATVTITVVGAPPAVTLLPSSGITDPTNVLPIPFIVVFSKSVTGFVQGDIAVTNGSVTSFSGSGTTYGFSLTPAGQGMVTARVPGGVAQDAGGNWNTASATVSRVYDSIKPVLAEENPVPTPTNDATPIYTFSSTEAGAITYGGDCSSATASASAGGNLITFNALPAGAHSNCTVRVTDAAGNQSAPLAVSAFTIDLTPPTLAEVIPVPTPTKNATPIYVFNSTEAGAITYGGDCSSALATAIAGPTNATFNALPAGAHSNCTVRVTDAAGNQSAPLAVSAFTIDLTPPDTSVTSSPANPTNSTAASFTFSCSDGGGAGCGSSFDCRLDGGAWSACNSPKVYSSLAAGDHTFGVLARDNAGNVDPSPASFSWTVDTSAPDTQITARPSDPTNATSASFSFASSKPGSTFECRLDGGAWQACASPKTYPEPPAPAFTAGLRRFEVRATDAAGNTDASPAVFDWTVDLTKPTTTIDLGQAPPLRSRLTNATIHFSCDETCSQFLCWFDNDPWATCGSPWTRIGLTDGHHVFKVRAQDAAGNWEMTDIFEWDVDTTAPETSLVAPQPANPTNATSAGFGFTSTEPGSTFECRLDGAAWSACVSPRNYSSLADGGHLFEVQATDTFGNTDLTPASYGWTVDLLPPESTLVAVPPPLTQETDYSFTFMAQPPDELTATFDCDLDNGGWTPCPGGLKSYGLPPDAPLTNGGHLFKVRARDAAGNVDPTPASYSWVIDNQPPWITPCCGALGSGGDEFVFDRTHETVTLKWTTSEPADAYADYDLTTDYFNWASDPANPTLKTDHVVTITGLWPDTQYFFRVNSADQAGNTATACGAGACIFRSKPQPDLIPPGEVSNVARQAGDQWVQTDWTNPTDADFDHLVVRRGTAGGCPASPADGVAIALSGPKATSFTDTGVTNGLAYCYVIFTYDQALPVNNRSAGYHLDDVRPTAFAITAPQVSDPNARTASFNWGTTEPALSYLFYGASTTTLIPANDGNAVVPPYAITGLLPGIKYYWYVRAVSTFDGQAVQTPLLNFVKSAPPAAGTGGGNVTGWWWSSTIGWISLNCGNFGTCPTSEYGVNLQDVPGASGNRATLGGFAWSETLGWICVGAACADPTPEGGLSYAEWRRFVPDGTPTGRREQFYGWAKVMSLGDAGWISLNCFNLNQPAFDTCAESDYYVIFGPDGYFADLSDPVNRFRNHYGWSGNDQGTGIGWVDTSLSFANWAPSRLGRVQRPWGIYEPVPPANVPGGKPSHPSTFGITVSGIYAPAYSFLECRLGKPNGQVEFVSRPLGEDAMRDATETFVYTVPPEFNDQQARDIEQNRLWYIDSCYLASVTTEKACVRDADCSTNAICDEIAGLCREVLYASARKPLFTHFNQWTLFGASDDFYQAVKCYASFPGQFFQNPNRCEFTGDASMSMAMSKGMPVERDCNNFDALGNPIDDDNNGQANCDDRFCQGIAYFCQRHLPTRCIRGQSGGTLGDCTAVGYHLGDLCCGDQPVALGSGFNQIVNGLECAYGDSDDGYFDCDCLPDKFGQTADCYAPGHQAGEFCCTTDNEVSKE